MKNKSNKFIKRVNRGEAIKAEWMNGIVNAVNDRIVPRINKTSVSSSGTTSPDCPFGQVKSGRVLGGVVHCGDKNYEVASYPLSSLPVGDSKYVWITVSDVTPNRDDDGELLLPGVETCGMTSITDSAWNTGASIPDNTNPTVTVDGTIQLPIGVYNKTEDTPTSSGSTQFTVFYGCGNFMITHCAGTLAYYRGDY